MPTLKTSEVVRESTVLKDAVTPAGSLDATRLALVDVRPTIFARTKLIGELSPLWPWPKVTPGAEGIRLKLGFATVTLNVRAPDRPDDVPVTVTGYFPGMAVALGVNTNEDGLPLAAYEVFSFAVRLPGTPETVRKALPLNPF